VLKHQKNC